MDFKKDIHLILIIIGIMLSITGNVGAIFGAALIICATYSEYQKSKKIGDINKEFNDKRERIKNLDTVYEEMKKDKEAELNKQLEPIITDLEEKQNKLNNISEELDKLEKDRIKEVDEKISDKYEKIDQLEEEIKSLKEDLVHLEEDKQNKLDDFSKELDKLEKNRIKEVDERLSDKYDKINQLEEEIKSLKKELVLVQDEIEYQNFGLYEPKYDFINSTAYKERLDILRKQQKAMIKNKTAAVATTNWTVDGSKRKGTKLTNDNIKQVLRTFNNECENAINKVKHSNLESSRKRIQKSYDQLNKLNKTNGIIITEQFLDLKFDEMQVAYEYDLKVQEEKELLREAKEKEREEKKIQKQLEKEKNKFNRENTRLESEIEKYKKKIDESAAKEKEKLEKEIEKLKQTIEKNNNEIKRIDDWKEKSGAGYVYIISNIGSFGENIFKIGVTRRDNPEERIRELSSASVPFKYDTHAFIFSKDAFSLESKLHKRFDKQRVNKMNTRKEFFNITIDDVKQIVEENKASVHSFVEKPEAEEYYGTLEIEKHIKSTS